MSDFINSIKASVLNIKSSEIDKDIDASFKSIEKYSVSSDKNKYVETISKLITGSGIDNTADLFKGTQALPQIQNYDQSGRLSRYGEYDAITKKISYCQRALEVLVDNVLSPDDITKRSIQYVNEGESDSVDINNCIARCRTIEKKIKLEQKTKPIIKRTLKKGDCFVEIIESPNGENVLNILNENMTFLNEGMIQLGESITRKIEYQYDDNDDDNKTKVKNKTLSVRIEATTQTGMISGLTSDNSDEEKPENKFKSKFDGDSTKNDGTELKDIFITIHDPQYIIRLETERFKSCLGYLVFPKLDPSSIQAGSLTIGGVQTVDKLCQDILNNIQKNLQTSNDNLKLSDDLKKYLVTYLKDIKDNKDLNVRYVAPELMVHWRINVDSFAPYGESIFECVNFDCRLLMALKTAKTIKNLTHATDKRVINVETGLPRDSKNIVESLKESISKRKISIDSMGSIDTIPSQIPTFETIYIPMRDGKKFVEIDNQTWGMSPQEDVEHLKFIRDNIVANMNVPAPYLGLEENMCFSFNTKIPLLEGYSISMGQLVEEYEKDPDNFNQWTYSIDPETNNIVAGKIIKAIRTRQNAEMVRVHLDNNEFEECTPDHKWMLRDGSYKEAKDLQEGDSLMPFYMRKSSYKTKNNTPYMQVYHPGKRKWQSIYRMVQESLGNVKQDDGMHVHHIDENPLNNHPDNLLVCSRDKHNRIHNKDCRYNAQNPETYSIIETRNCVICNESFTCKIQSNQTTCLSDECKTERKRLDGLKSWERRKQLCGNDYNIIEAKCAVCNKEFKTYQKYLTERTDKWITCGNYNCGRVIAGRKKTYNIYGDDTTLKLTCEVCKKEFELDVRQEHTTNTCSVKCRNTVLARRRFKDNRQKSNCSFCGKPIITVKYQRDHNRYISCDNEECKKLKQGVELWLNHNSDKSIDDYINLKAPHLNHKVSKVEFLNEKQNCCDLEIENYHNFALSSGVFVHNSNRSLLTVENINFCRTIISMQKELSIPLKELFYKIMARTHPESLEYLNLVQITFPEPKISPYEHQMEYIEQMQRLIEALKALDVPEEYLKEKYLPNIDWDEIKRFKAKKNLSIEIGDEQDDEQGGMGGMY